MTTTPPMLLVAPTPSTPRHGAKYDSHQPFTIRRSIRVSTQRAARTPSPDSNLSSLGRSASVTKKASMLRSKPHEISPPSSAQTTPVSKARKAKRASSNIYSVDLGGAGSPGRTEREGSSSNQNSTLFPNMLPTPAKSPAKKVTMSNLGSAARVVFPYRPETVAEAMPTPRKKQNKRHAGFSLGDYGNEDGDESKIKIYTDSHDRIPEVDESADNPFYVKAGGESSTKGGKGKKAKYSKLTTEELNVPCNREVQECLKRGEGMIYTHRGKKIYKPFAIDPELTGSSVDSDWHAARSSLQPRFLFPHAKPDSGATKGNTTDEEAVTDIEDHHGHEMLDVDNEAEPLVTPIKPTFAASTPPASERTTKATAKNTTLNQPVDKLNASTTGDSTASHFHEWQRPKLGITTLAKGRKRCAEDSSETEETPVKKVKTRRH